MHHGKAEHQEQRDLVFFVGGGGVGHNKPGS